ncbi:MAG TPA: hypothetical protein VF881_20375, partial [Polyangiaceae bacterium]
LHYQAGSVPLGAAHLSMQLIDTSGNVAVRIDPDQSLLFPQSQGDPTGYGTYAASSGLEITAAQAFDSTFGGERNHFGRGLGRRVHMSLQPNSTGGLEGTFTDTLINVFATPVTVTGSAVFDYEAPLEDPSFTAQAEPPMPDSGGRALELGDVPAWKGWATSCDLYLPCPGAGSTFLDRIRCAEQTYFAPLPNNMPGKGAASDLGAEPFADIAGACRASLGADNVAAWQGSATASQCAAIPPLACALRLTAGRSSADVNNGYAFGTLMGETLAPALLVAKDSLVHALYDSLSTGIDGEAERYDEAMRALEPVAMWVMQVPVLEYMRSLTSQAAYGAPDPLLGGANKPYPSASALADMLVTMSTIDGERARIAVTAPSSSGKAPLRDAQNRALLAYFEAATLAEILRAWGTAPSSIAASFTGVLTPLDQGFAALLQGANAFGVPDGFVPFVRPDGATSTNFQQMLAIASNAVTAEQNAETAFLADKRAYEANTKSLNLELNGVRAQFDLQLADVCGKSFKVETAIGPDAFTMCGADGTGDIGILRNQADQTLARLHSSQARIMGMKEKIGIDQHALAETQQVHEDTLKFVSSTGQQLAGIAMAEGVINAAEKFIDGLSTSVTSFGASAAAGAANALFELERAGLEVQKQNLQTAQQMRFERAGAQIELINGMANIQKETVDLAQLGVDIQQDALGYAGALLQVQNKLDQVKRLLEERGRLLAQVSSDPANDPSFRILRDQDSLRMLTTRANAQRQLYLAGRALEYELNLPLSTIGGAIFRATRHDSLNDLATCFQSIFDSSRIAFGRPNDYTNAISVRKMLGIAGPRKDEVTGETLSEGMQFRELLLRNENLDGSGGVGVSFSTNLAPGNSLWASDVCADRIATVQAQIVGDFLGDNEARVQVVLAGDAVMRACDSDTSRPGRSIRRVPRVPRRWLRSERASTPSAKARRMEVSSASRWRARRGASSFRVGTPHLKTPIST